MFSKRHLAITVLVLTVHVANSTIFKYGSFPNGKAHNHIGTMWDYSSSGADWNGTDAEGQPWLCLTGYSQSPINIATYQGLPAISSANAAAFDLGVLTSNGSNVAVINNGHTVQLQWEDQGWAPSLTFAVPGPSSRLPDGLSLSSSGARVSATPRQLHVHVHSEHLAAGRLAPLEVHVLSHVSGDVLPGCGTAGCMAVLAVPFVLSADPSQDDPFLAALADAAPEVEAEESFLAAGLSLNLSALLPTNRSYAAYVGSLTTPPCTEGVLWNVLMTPRELSLSQLLKFKRAIGDYDCSLQAQAGPAGGNGSLSVHNPGRRLLTRALSASESASTAGTQQHVMDVNGTEMLCHKLTSGNNARLPQPLNGRAVYAYVDALPAVPQSSISQYIPSDSATALTDGAIAGIVIGVLIGAGAAVGITILVVRRARKRKTGKMFWPLGEENMRMMDFGDGSIRAGGGAAAGI